MHASWDINKNKLKQSSVGRKTVAVHIPTIPCETYTAHKVQGISYFYNICPCADDIVYATGLKMLKLFCTFYECC